MKEWTIPDLADLEYFLALDGTSPDEEVTRRDRRIFHNAIEPVMEDSSLQAFPFRQHALRIWLDERRALFAAQQPDTVLPGGKLSESISFLRLVTGIFGLITGAGLAFSLLTYTGHAAVNVSLYLGVLVFFQLFTLLWMVRFFFFKSSLNTLRHYSLLYGGLIRIMERITRKSTQAAMNRLDGGSRTDLRAVTGYIQGMYGVYGKVLFWTLFAVVQIFGIMFNLGAMGATLARVFTSDLAFGWQSTVQMGSETVHMLVKIMAVPWAWLLGSYAYPSLEQIEGSRIILKEGMAMLATGNLVSWWPFLLAALVCYGLLPRMILAFIASMGENRALKGLRFTHVGCEAILLRMSAPGISTRGEPDKPAIATPKAAKPESPRPAPTYLTYIESLALVPEDIAPHCDEARINNYAGARMGWNVNQVLNITGDIEHDLPLIDASVRSHASVEGGVLLVQEAWMPPIVETTALIHELRALGGKIMPIAVLLIGKPGPDTIFTPPRAGDMEMWDKALAALADPYLSIISVEDA